MNEQRDRLSASDMSSLLAERGPIHVHVGGTLVIDGKPPEFEELLEHVETRLALVPRFRQKVTEARVGLVNPRWGDDADFDLRWHVRHVALPAPGSIDQLRDLVGRVLSQPLDFSRPLWQLYLIEGLEGKRHAYLSKTHHALVDGVSAMDVGTIMLDPNPDGTEMEIPEEPWEPDEPSPDLVFVRGARERIRQPLRVARKAARSALAMPMETSRSVMKTAEGFAGLAAGGPSAPPSPFNVNIGRDRLVSYVKTDLQTLKDARGQSGATVNDVVLSVVAGGLARFMRDRGDQLPEYLVALVPVSIRREDEKGDLGNRITTILVKLPLRQDDPAARLAQIHADTTRLKESEQGRAASLLIEASGWAPPTINRVLAGAMARPLTWNLVVSNVPGPQMPFYLLGRKMLEVYPFVPLSPQGHALSVGLLSYDGAVFFGLAGDRNVVADLDDFGTAIEASLQEQTSAAQS